jgi:hypothetical protein
VIDSFAPVDPKLVDVAVPEDGYPAHLAAEDTPDVLRDVCGSASREFPESLWIDPKDWDDKARDNDKYGTWPRNYSDRLSNQNPSHECVYHSAVAGLEVCWNRQRGVIYPEGGKKDFRYPESAKFHSVWFSPLSGYARVQPRQWGGSNVRQSLEILTKDGLLPDKIQPRDYGFRHVLQGTSGKGNSNQSGGGWIAERDFPENWRDTAKHFRVKEAIFASSWEQVICLILHGIAYHIGRRGHAVPLVRYLPGQGCEIKDSYDVYRVDSMASVKSSWSSGYGIYSMTMPDDWNRPAG